MKNLIRTEIKFFIYSKVLIGLALLFGFFMFATSWMSYQFCDSSLKQYNHLMQYLVDTKADLDAEKAAQSIVYDDGTIENPLPYEIDQVENALSNIVPQNSITLFGESCTLFLPIIAFLVGIVLVSSDDKNKTLKLKVASFGKQKTNISKMISGIIILAFLIFIALIVIKLSTAILYSKIQDEYDISTFNISIVNSNVQFSQCMFTVCSAVVYLVLGYCISNVFHCYTFIALAISLISFFLPTLFKYDFINAKNTIEKCFFSFNGVVNPGEGFPLSIKTAALEMIIICLLFIALNQLVIKKRSAYA